MVVFRMRKSIQASTPHFLTQLFFFFTTLAASSHIFTDYQHLSLVKVPSHYRDSPRRNPMLNNIPNTIALSYRQQQCAEMRGETAIPSTILFSFRAFILFCPGKCAAERKSHAVKCVCVCTCVLGYLCLCLISLPTKRHKGKSSL